MEDIDDLQHAQQAVRELQADVSSALDRYTDVCASILSTLRPRLLSSLRISIPPSVPDSALLALLDEPSLTPSAPHPLVGGYELPGPAWVRLQRRWVEVRGLEEMIRKMREGQEVGDLQGLEEVEGRMRAMGIQPQQLSERRDGDSSTDGAGSSGG